MLYRLLVTGRSKPHESKRSIDITVPDILLNHTAMANLKRRRIIMADWKDNLEDKMDDTDNKANELKGRAEQKKEDMQDSTA